MYPFTNKYKFFLNFKRFRGKSPQYNFECHEYEQYIVYKS